ncbi:hypothetical protein EVAR_66500_1, partial [Eumeta japonica]
QYDDNVRRRPINVLPESLNERFDSIDKLAHCHDRTRATSSSKATLSSTEQPPLYTEPHTFS